MGAIPASVQGVLWMAAAGIAFSVMSTLIRPAAEHLHSLQIVFLRNLIGLLILGPFVARSVELRLWRAATIKLHLVRACVTVGAMACWFTAIPKVPLSEAIALNFTAPMFVTVLAAVFLKERVRMRRLAALGIGFIGVLVVLRPGFQQITLSQVLIVLDAGFWGTAIILIRVLSRTDAPQTIVAYMFILVLPISAVPAMFVWQTPDAFTLLIVVGIAISSTIGHYCSTRAFSVTEVSVVMPFDFLRLVWFTLAGYVAFAEIPDRLTVLGAVIIATSSSYLLLREHALARQKRARPRAARRHDFRPSEEHPHRPESFLPGEGG